MRRSQPIATLSLFFSFALLTSQTLAADFTGKVVVVHYGRTIVAPLVHATPTLDTSLRTA